MRLIHRNNKKRGKKRKGMKKKIRSKDKVETEK